MRRALARIPWTARCEPNEWLGFVPRYRSGRWGKLRVVEKGAKTHVHVDPAELFARILTLRPEAFVLVHNHPSGALVPSQADLLLTDQVRAVARRLGVGFPGHWIVAASGEHWIASC
ncbi:MAG TPA: JAB domain-containing protein [Bdellovibrionota bacterium]|nr:JAB domain-containing protein [Bdellovibrionota bacterium]